MTSWREEVLLLSLIDRTGQEGECVSWTYCVWTCALKTVMIKKDNEADGFQISIFELLLLFLENKCNYVE